jgi:hypothetical protein
MCISQPGMQIFWAMIDIRGWIAIGDGTINAFAQANPPKELIFMRIDDQMAKWMEDFTGMIPDRTIVTHVLCALQGHQAAGSS